METEIQTKERPPAGPTLTLQFQDAEDLRWFAAYCQQAKKQQGTVTGLASHLACSAIKRAKIVKPVVMVEVSGGVAELVFSTPGVMVTVQDNDNEVNGHE